MRSVRPAGSTSVTVTAPLVATLLRSVTKTAYVAGRPMYRPAVTMSMRMSACFACCLTQRRTCCTDERAGAVMCAGARSGLELSRQRCTVDVMITLLFAGLLSMGETFTVFVITLFTGAVTFTLIFSEVADFAASDGDRVQVTSVPDALHVQPVPE